jgi:hypothetical protein
MSLKSTEKKRDSKSREFHIFPDVEVACCNGEGERQKGLGDDRSETKAQRRTKMVKIFYFNFALAPPDKCISPSNFYALRLLLPGEQ